MSKYQVFFVEPKALTNGKQMKSLTLQREGAQFPIKSVAMWQEHPLFATIAAGQTHDLEIIEKDSTTPNPHKPGTFFKNRSVANGTAPQGGNLAADVADLKRRVFALESHFKPQNDEEDTLDEASVPF